MMDLHNAQLLVLAVFLASPLALPEHWWSGGWRVRDGEAGAPLLRWRWCRDKGGLAPSLGWADPWMQEWAADQLDKQAAGQIAGALPTFCSPRVDMSASSNQNPPRAQWDRHWHSAGICRHAIKA